MVRFRLAGICAVSTSWHGRFNECHYIVLVVLGGH